jgi:tetratricopeptide (TPR) repeat protein
MKYMDLSVAVLLRWDGQPPVPEGVSDNLQFLERYAQDLDISPVPEAMQILGLLAGVFRLRGELERSIPMLEKLCELAETDITSKGRSATSDDIRATGIDLVLLGTTYKIQNRLLEARRALDKARQLLRRIDWDVEVDKLLAGEETTMGPTSDVHEGRSRMYWTAATGEWTQR